MHALGPLRVERDGAPIERWGGDKAGTRQAEALFAFLFDRGERGVTKDEVLQIDLARHRPLERADLAFHRTMVGLRGTLDPGRGRKSVIRFHNDRYRLDPAVIAWSERPSFLARLEPRRGEAPAADRIRLLEEARTLYRGEYLDDCPFYGDSSHGRGARGLAARAVPRPAVGAGRGVRGPGRPRLRGRRVPGGGLGRWRTRPAARDWPAP